jgi:hypothetical protein
MTRRARVRVLLESLALVILLVPLHFFLQRPDPTAWSTAAALLLVFLPAMLAVARVEAGPRGVAAEALAYLVFGFGLGLLVGGLGALGRAILHAATGEPVPMRLALWVAIAAGWALACGAAYGLILFLVWALRVAMPPPRSAAYPVGRAAAPPAAGGPPRLRSGLNRLASGLAAPGRRLVLAASLFGLAGLSLAMAGLIVIFEGWASGRTLLVLGGAALVAMVVLRLAAARDRRPLRR